MNFSLIRSNIAASPPYELHISYMIRYCRACASSLDFYDRRLLLTRKLLNQGFIAVKLKLLLLSLYDRCHYLVNRHGIHESHMFRLLYSVIILSFFPRSWFIIEYGISPDINMTNTTGATTLQLRFSVCIIVCIFAPFLICIVCSYKIYNFMRLLWWWFHGLSIFIF